MAFGLLNDEFETNPALIQKLMNLGLLNQTGQLGQAGQAVSPSQPSLSVQPQVQPKSQEPDWSQLLTEKGDKTKWMLPVGLGLLNMGANMAGPYYPGQQAPPWARGVQGFTQGVMSGTQMQKQQQEELYKKVQTILGLKKAFGQPEVFEIGGQKVVRGADGRMLKIDDSGGKARTEAERLADNFIKQGMTPEEAIKKAHETIESGKTAGKPDNEKLNEYTLAANAVRQETGQEPTPSQIISKVTQVRNERRPEAAEKEQEIVLAATAQELGKSVDALTPMEKEAAILKHKQSITSAGAVGKVEGAEIGTAKSVATMGDQILRGKAVLSQVKNAFGDAQSNRVMSWIAERDPSFNFIQAEANAKWYQNPGTQRLIRRTESIVAPDGPIDEALRMAKEVKFPIGTKLNELTGDAAVQLGNSKIQLLRMINDISAEEQQQIFGAVGGGEKFLELARGLANPNMSIEQYTNSLKEIRHLIMTRQLANVRGTPEQETWEKMADKFKIERPYLRVSPTQSAQSGQQPQAAGFPKIYNDPTKGKMTFSGYDPQTNRPVYQDSTGKKFLGRQ